MHSWGSIPLDSNAAIPTPSFIFWVEPCNLVCVHNNALHTCYMYMSKIRRYGIVTGNCVYKKEVCTYAIEGIGILSSSIQQVTHRLWSDLQK